MKHQTPIQALQTWQAEKPDLFVKRVYKQTGLNTKLHVAIPCGSWPAGVRDAALLMQPQTSNRALRQGTEIAEEPAVVALCEKRLAGCLSAFLGKQPDTRPVPRVSVKHWQSQS